MRHSLTHIALGLVIATAAACGGQDPAPTTPASPTPVATPAAPAAPAPAPAAAPANTSTCSDAGSTEAQVAYADAQALDAAVKRGEKDKHDTYAQRIGLYRKAAEGGHLEGQFKFGGTAFSTMFMIQAPEASEKDDYIRALTYLFIAALRGHAKAEGYLPGLKELLHAKELPKEMKIPLDSVPRDWIASALAAARADKCVAKAK